MTSERISIPPDVAYGLQAAAGFKSGKLAFAAPSVAQVLFFSGVFSAAVMAWAFDPTCINGRRSGPYGCITAAMTRLCPTPRP